MGCSVFVLFSDFAVSPAGDEVWVRHIDQSDSNTIQGESTTSFTGYLIDVWGQAGTRHSSQQRPDQGIYCCTFSRFVFSFVFEKLFDCLKIEVLIKICVQSFNKWFCFDSKYKIYCWYQLVTAGLQWVNFLQWRTKPNNNSSMRDFSKSTTVLIQWNFHSNALICYCIWFSSIMNRKCQAFVRRHCLIIQQCLSALGHNSRSLVGHQRQ